MTITWHEFDGTKFQNLCNALLVQEISKRAKVFSGSGPDGGIDQLYKGSYGGKSGLWRFQDKFHNSGNKSKDTTAFKSDIKKDIKANFKDEDIIVYLTNLEFPPKRLKELEDMASAELKTITKTVPEVQIWNHGKVQGLLASHPLVFNAFWDKGPKVLKPFKEYFIAQLTAMGDETRWQLINRFFGRGQQFNMLSDFLGSTDIKTMAVIGSGGSGKTRLVVQYCIDVLDTKDEWYPYVLLPTEYSPTKIDLLFHSKHRLLIIADDAHKYPDQTAELKKQIEGQNKHKLIITTRNTLFDRLHKSFSSLTRNLSKLELSPLEFEERKELLQAELPGLQGEHVSQIASLSRGVPILLLEIIRIVRNQKQPFEVITEETFRHSVNEYYDEAANEISDKEGLGKKLVKDFVKVIACIRPFSWEKEHIAVLAKLLNIENDEVEQLKSAWFKSHLVEKYQYLVDIKPDIYGDILLSDVLSENRKFIEKVIKNCTQFNENILINLSSIETDNIEISNYIDQMIQQRIEEDGRNDNLTNDLIHFTFRIVGRKPEIGYKGARMFIDKVLKLSVTKQYWPGTTVEAILKTLHHHSGDGKIDAKLVFELLVDYAFMAGANDFLEKCMQYSQLDFQGKGNYSNWGLRQLNIIDIITDTIQNSSGDRQKAALSMSKGLLDFEISHDSYYEKETSKVLYATGNVPMVDNVSQVRFKIINVLIKQYRVELEETAKQKIELLLLDFFFHAFGGFSHRVKSFLDFEEETKFVLSFWESQLESTPTVELKEKILGKIGQYETRGILPAFTDTIELIKQKANSHPSLRDKLKALILRFDYLYIRTKFEKDCQSLIAEYESTAQILNDLNELQDNGNIDLINSNYYNIYRCLSKNDPSMVQNVVDDIYANFPDKLGETLNMLPDTIDQGWLYRYIERLYQLDSLKNMRAIIVALTYKRKQDWRQYQADDLKYFEEAVEAKMSALYDGMAAILPDYAYVDKVRTFKILDTIIKQQAVSDGKALIIYAMIVKTGGFHKTFTSEIRDLIFGNLPYLPKDGSITDSIFSFIDEHYGFEVLRDLVNGIYLLRNERSKRSMPNPTDYRYRNEEIEYETCCDRFMLVIKEAIHADEALLGKFKNQLAIFRPDDSLSDEHAGQLRTFMLEIGTNYNLIMRLNECLAIYPRTNENRLRLSAHIAERTLQIVKGRANPAEVLGTLMDYEMGTKGRKGVLVGMDEDIKIKETLEELIDSSTFSQTIVAYLRKLAQGVQQFIDDAISRDREEMN